MRERYAGLVVPDGIHADHVVLKMIGETKKADVFRALAQADLDVESFGDYRPSLNDILWKVQVMRHEAVSERFEI